MNFRAEFNVYYDINFLPRLKIKYSIPLNQINFIKRDENYIAKYRISTILKMRGKQTGGNEWDRTYITDDYSQTIDDKTFIRDFVDVPIQYGKLAVYLKIWDKNSQRYGEIRKGLVVDSINDFYISKPYIEEMYGDTIYSDSFIKASVNIYDKSSETIYMLCRLSDGKNKDYVKKDTLLTVNFHKTLTITFPVKNLVENSYILRFKKSESNIETQLKFYLEKPFFKSKRFLESIDELIYIASQAFIDSLKKANPEQRIKLWKRFWKEKDPTPSTEKNEVKDEYFSKVDYANEHFKSPFLPGWKTDMGKIYIKFGPPDEIEKHPFELNSKPYEIWYYYTRKMKFIFVDEYNLENYTLVYPRGF